MLCRLFCATVILCLAVNCAVAQDPTKVEPRHYKLLFENGTMDGLLAKSYSKYKAH